jgi:recombination protein RecA
MPPKTKKTYSTDWKPMKATDAAITKFEEQFAKEMGLGVLSRSDEIVEYEVIPFGSLEVDYASGIGGAPLGRVIEMWGPEHAGKTTGAMRLVAQAQKKYPHKMTAWVDMEQTFDKKWAVANGVDLKRLWLVENPKTANDVADATKRFVESGLCSVVVLDSIGGMISKREFEKESDEDTVAEVAKIVTRMVKQCSPMGKSNGTITCVINQVRAGNVGGGYGPDTVSSGGWALKHISSMKIKVQRGNSQPLTINQDGKPVPVGYETTYKFEKNKCAPYGKVANVWVFNQATDKFGPVGVDIVEEAIVFGLRFDIIRGKGTAWNTLPNGERFNGAEKLKAYLQEHPEVVEEIRNEVLATLSGTILDDDTNPDEGASEDPMEAMLDTADRRPVKS